MYLLSEDGNLLPASEGASTPPVAESGDGGEGGQELGAMPKTFLSASKDYVSRARYLAGSPRPETADLPPPQSTAADVKRAINKLERAVTELRSGMFGEPETARTGRSGS